MNEDTELMLDVGQANELKLALRKAGFTNADIKRMCEGEILGDMLPIIRGHAKIEVIQHLLDCTEDPFIPRNNWTIEYHDTSLGPQFELDVSKFELYLSDNQVGSQISGNELRKELENKPVLNANVLDYLLAHPELIPEEWKEKYIFFWGTIYRSSDGYLFVRCLRWIGDEWDWNYDWLTNDWNSDDPAVVLASN